MTQLMNNSKLAFAAILLLFLMLWVPLGQSEFLIENWMKLGTYAAPLVLFVFFSTRTEKTRSVSIDIKLMSVLFLVAYI
ncbi:MAG: hypothetical protein AAF722_20165, partial [Cyanobacteria bacterium P01_C01_bin.70]